SSDLSSTANSRLRSARMRAIRNRYFARSLAGRVDHDANASRAAATAFATSASVAWLTSASGASSRGDTVVKCSAVSSHSPPTYKPYRSRSLTMSVDSGAGAYVQPAGTGLRSPRFATSVIREVILGLVGARALLAELHEDVVDEARRADAVEVRRQPVGPERLVHLHEVLDRVLRGADATRRLHADLAPRLFVHVADRLEHHERHRPPSRAATRGARCRTCRAPRPRGSPSGAPRRRPPSP